MHNRTLFLKKKYLITNLILISLYVTKIKEKTSYWFLASLGQIIHTVIPMHKAKVTLSMKYFLSLSLHVMSLIKRKNTLQVN